MSDALTIVLTTGGKAVRLSTPALWARAIEHRDLRRETIVGVEAGGRPREERRAGDIEQLQPLFDELDPIPPTPVVEAPAVEAAGAEEEENSVSSTAEAPKDADPDGTTEIGALASKTPLQDVAPEAPSVGTDTRSPDAEAKRPQTPPPPTNTVVIPSPITPPPITSPSGVAKPSAKSGAAPWGLGGVTLVLLLIVRGCWMSFHPSLSPSNTTVPTSQIPLAPTPSTPESSTPAPTDTGDGQGTGSNETPPPPPPSAAAPSTGAPAPDQAAAPSAPAAAPPAAPEPPPPDTSGTVNGVAVVVSPTQLIVGGRAITLFGVKPGSVTPDLTPYRRFIAGAGPVTCSPAGGAYICFDDALHRDVAGMVVNNGLALTTVDRYQPAEEHARQARKGVWASGD